jgi:predicted acylesterase/phospholipase RssA/CRP-like cAMP-binding protein
MTKDKVLLLRLHPCSRGLSDEAIEEVAEAAEYIRCRPGDVVSRAGEPITSIYLVIHGRLRLQLVDFRGNVVLQRFQSAGGQFGGLGASVAEPTPVHCIAEDPSVLLRIEYPRALELAKKYEALRANYVRLIEDSVKQALFNDKTPVRPTLVGFLHESDETRVVSQRVLKRLADLGESVCVFADRATEVEGIHYRPILAADPRTTLEEIWRQAGEWRQTGRAVFDVETAVQLGQASQGFEACERVFWCATPANWERSLNRLKAIESQASGWRDKVSIVWLLRSEEAAPVATALRTMAGCDFKVSFGQPGATQGPVVLEGLDRLVHFLRGIQIGVALGGGAARGMAHLGVLKALQQSGITVDRIAGTSAGAMTGMVYAAGFDPDYSVERFVTDLRPSWFFRCLPRGEQWFLLYKYRRGHFEPMLRKYLDDRRIEQLPIPMHAITVDLIRGRAVVRESGDAVHAILESINLPLLAKPINRYGESLVDGGLINNVPADVLTAKGCNFVIAVSVTAKIEHEFAGNLPDTPADQMRPASTIQTLLRSFLVQNHSVNTLGVQPADSVIEPDVTRFELAEFTRTDELAAIGEQAALQVVPEIRRLLNRLDPALFPISDSGPSVVGSD